MKNELTFEDILKRKKNIVKYLKNNKDVYVSTGNYSCINDNDNESNRLLYINSLLNVVESEYSNCICKKKSLINISSFDNKDYFLPYHSEKDWSKKDLNYTSIFDTALNNLTIHYFVNKGYRNEELYWCLLNETNKKRTLKKVISQPEYSLYLINTRLYNYKELKKQNIENILQSSKTLKNDYYMFTEIEIKQLDDLFLFIKEKSEKLRTVGYERPCFEITFPTKDNNYNKNLLMFFYENKEILLNGELTEKLVAKASSTEHSNYSFETDKIYMSSVKISENEILISINIHKHYYNYDGRNSDSGCNIEKYRFITSKI